MASRPMAEFAGSAAGSVVVPPWAAILGEAEPASGDEAVELVFDSPRERMEIGPQPVAREVLMLLPLELLRQDARDGGQKDERLYLVDHVRDLPESGKRNHSRVRLIRSTVFRHRSGCTWVSAGRRRGRRAHADDQPRRSCARPRRRAA